MSINHAILKKEKEGQRLDVRSKDNIGEYLSDLAGLINDEA